MGQYYKIVNLDRAEYLDPVVFPWCGAKFGESWHEFLLGFAVLLAKSDGNGVEGDVGEKQPPSPTDAPDEEEVVEGRWAGERVVIIGDYDSSGLYHQLKRSGSYRDITLLLIDHLRNAEARARQEREAYMNRPITTVEHDPLKEIEDLPDPFEE